LANYRSRSSLYGGGGRGGFNTMGLAFPPFTPAVKWLVLANTAVYLLMLILGVTLPAWEHNLLGWFQLLPIAVVHGWIWQVVTYSFLHAGLFHILFNMLALWMFGSQLETDWGRSKFYEFYFLCVVGAALTTIGIGYLGVGLAHAFYPGGGAPTLFRIFENIAYVGTIGSSGGVFGIFMAYAILHGDNQIMLFPIPITIRAKYMVAIWGLIALVGAISNVGGVANFAHLGGLLFGWLYVRYLPRRGLMFATSERYFGVRNAYYRWKRRRAAKKFEVYMRKHDRGDYFDEYGNYRDPGSPRDKPNGENRPPWVN